jgi:hypothetical protein
MHSNFLAIGHYSKSFQQNNTKMPAAIRRINTELAPTKDIEAQYDLENATVYLSSSPIIAAGLERNFSHV